LNVADATTSQGAVSLSQLNAATFPSNEFATLTELIAGGTGLSGNIKVLGYDVAGDGGHGQWARNGQVAQPVSQSPAQLVDILFNDSNGVQWQLVTDEAISIKQLGAKGDSGTTDNTAVLTAADSSSAKSIIIPSDGTGGVYDILSDYRPTTPLIGKGGYITRNGDAGIFYPRSWTDLASYDSQRGANQFGYKLLAVADANAATSPEDSVYFQEEYTQQLRLEMLNQSGFELYTDGGTGADGAITASDNTFISATASFVAGDVGKTIIVAGADTSVTDGSALTTTIATYTSATEVELTDAANDTVSGANYHYGTGTASGIEQIWLNQTHQGQNDCYNLYHAMSVSNIRNITEPTSWGFQPSGGFLNGQNNAATDKVNLYGYGDVVLQDQGYEDVSMLGQVFLVKHTGTSSGDYNTPRLVGLWKNTGSVDIDAIGSFAGKAYIGLDLSTGTFSGAALALSQDQTIAWDADGTTLNGEFASTSVSNTNTKFDGTTLTDTVAGNGILQRTQSAATIDSDIDSATHLTIRGISTTAGTTIGVIGTNTYFSAFSSGSDSTNLYLRTASSGTENIRFKIAPSGTCEPGADNTQSLGTSGTRWGDVFATEFHAGDGTTLWTTGSGTPESSVTAAIGSLYTRTDGGAGTTLYVKESGAGNTGWVAK